MQARLAAEHGKLVFLVSTLVEQEQWARDLVESGRAMVVNSVDDVVTRLSTPAETRSGADVIEQLAMRLG